MHCATCGLCGSLPNGCSRRREQSRIHVQAATQLAAPGGGPMARRLGRLLSSRPDLDLEVGFRVCTHT